MVSFFDQRRSGQSIIVALSCLISTGCLGGVSNPSYFPFLLPKGDVIRSHAKPPGFGYFADFDPHACRLEVRPENNANPIGTQQVYIATIYDDKGEPRRKRRVEWLIEGPGNIIEVDESGYLPGRGSKVDNKYAVSYTDYFEHKITRGNDDPNDDFMIRPGQSWCVVTGATEGETALTVYAPEINDWDKNRVIVRTRWFDCRWEFPQSTTIRAGADHILSSRVLRHSDSQPLPNYRVKYRIVEGPPAVLQPHPANGQPGAQELVAISDLNGQANVRIVQQNKEPGETKVAVEILRQSDANSPNGVGVLVSKSTAKVEWQAPQLALSMTASPTAGVGEEVPVTYVVKNTGQVESQAMTVRGYIPDGFDLIESVPPAQRNGNQLVWSMPALPSGQQHLLQTRMRSTRIGTLTSTGSVSTVDGLRADHGATTDVTAGQLRLTATAPDAGLIGETLPIQVTLSNSGNGPVTNIKLRIQYDGGFIHTSQHNPIEFVLERIDAGASKSMSIPLTAQQSGQWTVKASAIGDGDAKSDFAPLTILLKRAELELRTAATPRVFLNQSIEWTATVRNNGELPISNVIVRGVWPESVNFRTAEQGRIGRGQVQWDVGTLKAGEVRELRATGEATALTSRAVLQVSATGDALQSRTGETQVVSYRRSSGLERKAETALEVLGIPALQVEVTDLNDPITVGGRTRYTIRVTNKGTLPAREVDVVAVLPTQLKFLAGYGPKSPRVEKAEVIFGPIDTIAPNQPLTFAVDVETVAPGDVRFRAEVRSPILAKPVRVEEATRVLPETTRQK